MKNEAEEESKSLSGGSDIDSETAIRFKNLRDSQGDPS